MSSRATRSADLVMRRARPGDGADLAEVFVDAWRHAYTAILAPEVVDRWDLDEVTQWMETLVAETDTGGPVTELAISLERVVGFARYGTDPDRANGGYLFGLYVHPAAAGRGVGARLLTRACEELTRQGHRVLALHVFRANERARGLYEKHGLRPDGSERVEPEYGASEIRMTMALPRPDRAP